jgi:hypothetical protein
MAMTTSNSIKVNALEDLMRFFIRRIWQPGLIGFFLSGTTLKTFQRSRFEPADAADYRSSLHLSQPTPRRVTGLRTQPGAMETTGGVTKVWALNYNITFADSRHRQFW